YVPSVAASAVSTRRSYTPHVEGELPAIVMEFLSETQGEEYSVKRTHPPGKWFFYEQILQVPIYVIFDPAIGLLEFYQLQNGRYELQLPDPEGRHWISEMSLFLGTWRGSKEGRSGYWLRWWSEAGNLLAWAVEQIEQERQEKEQERQEKEQERRAKERLVAYLRSKGLDPDNLL
ncbi:MAG TPA: Uma2 family endonuclease, partial [Thermosynechococcaceae cyanobacterium]